MPHTGDQEPQAEPSVTFDPTAVIEEATEHQTGTFGEGQGAFLVNQLQEARQALDAGQITVSQFVDFARPVGQRAFEINQSISGQGGAAASAAGSAIAGPLQRNTGIKIEDGQVQFNLPDEFQSRLREELIPSNITGQQREELLRTIPFDIDINSPRFQVEREAVRQRIQGLEQVEEFRGIRQERLGGLEQLLQQSQQRQFGEAVPQISEQLQTRGLLQTSELEASFGREQSRLSAIRGELLSQQSLADREAELQGRAQVLQGQQGLQLAGLQREFSLEDFERAATLARETGAGVQLGQQQGGGFLSTVGGAAVGGTLGFAVGGPIGAVGGAIIGGARQATGGGGK